MNDQHLTPTQQAALDAYLNAAAPLYAYRAAHRAASHDSPAALEQYYAEMDRLSDQIAPYWDAVLDAGIPVATLDAATEQRFGVTVNRGHTHA